MLRDGDIVEYEESWDERKNKYMADNVSGGVREEDYGRGGRGGGGGRERSRGKYIRIEYFRHMYWTFCFGPLFVLTFCLYLSRVEQLFVG